MNVTNKPILFSGEMIRALLDGRKTQTRRVVKEYTIIRLSDRHGFATAGARHLSEKETPGYIYAETKEHQSIIGIPCPYGKPGDLLWVREAMCWHNDWLCYNADKTPIENMKCDKNFRGTVMPSIFMPKIYSRITLLIKDIRVERVQDISEQDAKFEGATLFNDIPMIRSSARPPRWSMENPHNTDQCLSSPYYAFANYWIKLNGQESWDSNPFVWVIEFEVIKQNIDKYLEKRDQ